MIHRYIIEATDEVKGFEEAIERLDREWGIEELEPCEDSISRQAVDELSKELVHTTRDKADFLCNFWEGLQKLPPVNLQEPKTGHWILTDDDFVYCSECEDSYYARPIDASWYYCPHCGAKMESEV